MSIRIEVDAVVAKRALERLPDEIRDRKDDFIETVGRKLEREAKYAMRANVAGPNQARSRTGNLVRHIIFHEPSRTVEAHASYSKYVHGAPFFTNRSPRKENPFFNTAMTRSEAFIKRKQRDFFNGIV